MSVGDQTNVRALQQIINYVEPASVLTIGHSAADAANWAEQHNGKHYSHTQLSLESHGLEEIMKVSADLALVSEALEELTHEDGVQLLGTLRNVGIAHIAVVVRDGPEWSFNDFIGLGFKRNATFSFDDHNLSLYTYNLASYNHKRDWNNAKNWANPEMWGKAWW